jgi:hypothetical protein
MSDQPLTKQKKDARKKGLAALGTAATTAMFMTMSVYFAVLGVPATAYMTYRWFKYRAEWGMKF